MKKIKISTVNKLIILLGLVVVGFSYVFYTSYINMNKMKNHIDVIYFGSYVQVMKLNNIKESYYILLREDKSVDYGMQRATILDEWNRYYNSYQSKEEKYVVERMDDLIAYSIDHLKGIKSSKILKIINSLDVIIKYEQDSAYYQKTQINESYTHTLNMLIFTSLIIGFFVMIIGYMIATSIKRSEDKLFTLASNLALINNELKTESITDPLTQLYNRRYFNEIFEKELKRMKREKSEIVFMMIDVDNFKKYNDTYGHQAGDEVLKSVSKTMQKTFARPEDFVFRLGGEEFGVITTNISLSNAHLMAKQLVKNVEDTKIEHSGNDASKYITISLGLFVEIPKINLTSDIIIKKSDDLLYIAKEGGRNKVVM